MYRKREREPCDAAFAKGGNWQKGVNEGKEMYTSAGTASSRS